MTPLWSAPRALLFDLDGTLVHSLPDLADAVDDMLASYGLPALGESMLSTMIGNGSHKLIERAVAASRWCGAPTASADLLAEAHQRFLQHYRLHFCRRSRLYPGVAAQLPALQQAGIALAVVTNKPIEFVQPLLHALGIGQYFAVLIGGDSLPEKKPSALPLQHACNALDVAIAETIMVGDSRTDIDAARAAGMRVIAVSYGYNHGEPIATAEPDAVLDSFSQLSALWS